MQKTIDLSTINWDKDYRLYLDYIVGLATEKLSKFNEKLIPTKYKIFGISVPIMKNIAKQIANGDFYTFFEVSKVDSFEEIMIYGMVIAVAKIDTKEKIKYLTMWSGVIDNWAHTDYVGAMLKCIIGQQDEYKYFIADLVVSGQEFKTRLAIVLLLNYYLDYEYVDHAIEMVSNITDDKYYVSMAIAWLVSVLYINNRSNAIKFLSTNNLSASTQNRAVQKIRDSLRVSNEDKQYVLKFKK